MSSPLEEAWSNLEPGCAEIAEHAGSIPAANQLILLSAATSLKRIADALCGDDTHAGLLYYLSGIEMNTRNR